MTKSTRFTFSAFPALFVLAGSLALGSGGPLEPPGPPGPTMKTLDQVEPRRAIAELPYAIDEPGAYYLTGNLSGEEGITIEVDGVTLDLMGFELAGGRGTGVEVVGDRNRIAIRNGIVRDWEGNGIDAGSAGSSSLENVKSFANGAAGLRVGEGSLVVGSQAAENGGDGIRADAGSAISNSIARDNSGRGIVLDRDGSIARCVASENGGDGVYVQSGGAVIRDCVSAGNGGHGIRLWGGTSLIEGNNTRNNEEWGIRISGRGTRIDGNHAVGNHGGIRIGNADNLIVRNTTQDNNSAYAIVSGNQVGPRGTLQEVGDHPWANIEL